MGPASGGTPEYRYAINPKDSRRRALQGRQENGHYLSAPDLDWLFLVHRLICGRHTAVGDLADFQGASDEQTLIRT